MTSGLLFILAVNGNAEGEHVRGAPQEQENSAAGTRSVPEPMMHGAVRAAF